MWLTGRELSNELHVGMWHVIELRRRKKITYINVGTDKQPNYRYQLPAPTFTHIAPPIERIPLLTVPEIAAMLGSSAQAVRQLIHCKRLKATRVGKRSMITVQDFRGYLALRERRHGQKKQSYSPILMRWLKGYLESREVPVQVLDTLIKTASEHAPLEKRSGYITKLWDLFDQVNRLLREIEN